MRSKSLNSLWERILSLVCVAFFCLDVCAQRLVDAENIKGTNPQLYKATCDLVKKNAKKKVRDACFMKSVDGKTFIRAVYDVVETMKGPEEVCALLTEDATQMVSYMIRWQPSKSTGSFYLPEVKPSDNPKAHRPTAEAFCQYHLLSNRGVFLRSFGHLTVAPQCIPPYTFKEVSGEIFYQDGRRMTPSNCIEVIPVGSRISEIDNCLTADFFKYKVKGPKGKILCGAVDIATSDTLPPLYGDIKKEDGNWFYRMHPYDIWTPVNPDNPVEEKDVTYHPAVLLADNGKYDEAINSLLKDTLTDIIERCLMYADISTNFSARAREKMQSFVVMALNNNEKEPAFIEEYDNMFGNLTSIHKFIVPFMDRMSKLKNSQYDYPHEILPILKKDSADIDSLYNIYNSIVSTRNFIQQKKEERRQKRLRIWGAVAATLVSVTADVISNYYDNKRQSAALASSSSSSSSRSSKSGGSGSSSSGGDDDNDDNNSSSGGGKQKTMKECSLCNGTGRVPNISIHNADGPESHCSECGQDAPKHTHKSCSICKGKGEVFDGYK